MLYDCRSPADRDRGIAAAIEAVKSGELVVLPTDTVYGIGADAFTPYAVTALLDAKGGAGTCRRRCWSAPGTPSTGWSTRCRQAARDLVEAFWPGALTIIVEHSPSLQWDLGDTGGTVAVRMPLHPVALEVLRETGPMAVSVGQQDRPAGRRRPPRRPATSSPTRCGPTWRPGPAPIRCRARSST